MPPREALTGSDDIGGRGHYDLRCPCLRRAYVRAAIEIDGASATTITITATTITHAARPAFTIAAAVSKAPTIVAPRCPSTTMRGLLVHRPLSIMGDTMLVSFLRRLPRMLHVAITATAAAASV